MTTQSPTPSSVQQGSNLSPFNIFVLPKDMVFPPLPPINDGGIYNIVTTHSSKYVDKKNPMDLDPRTMVEDYEKLEHVGDALLGAMITVLLHDLFPMLGEGPATTLKGSLVSNATLSRISEAYGIPKKLQANPSALLTARAQVKTKASMFEAWIAGVFYTVLSSIGEAENSEEGNDADDETSEAGEVCEVERVVLPDTQAPQEAESADQPKPSAQRPSDELNSALSKSLTLEEVPLVKSANDDKTIEDTSMTSPVIEEPTDITMASSTNSLPDTSQPKAPLNPMNPVEVPPSDTLLPACNLKYRWLAMTALDEWLRPLFTPIAHFALDQLRLESNRVANLPKAPSTQVVLDPKIVAEDSTALGSGGLLNAYVQQQKKALSVKYEFDECEEGWKAVCTLKMGKGEVIKGEGVRLNQKRAKALAAYRVCKQLDDLDMEQ